MRGRRLGGSDPSFMDPAHGFLRRPEPEQDEPEPEPIPEEDRVPAEPPEEEQ